MRSRPPTPAGAQVEPSGGRGYNPSSTPGREPAARGEIERTSTVKEIAPVRLVRSLRGRAVRRAIASLLLSLAASLLANAAAAATPRDGDASPFREAEYRAHFGFLADDLCEGRAPGTRGGELAALYIATQFQAFGLRPISEEAGYEQRVPLAGNLTHHESVRFSLRAGESATDLLPLEEVVVSAETAEAHVETGGDLLFVGFGIDAPEFAWDDFKGTDVRGAVLVMLLNDPDFEATGFGSESLTYYGRYTYKEEIARRKGARGVILLHTDASATYPFQVVRTSNGAERMAIDGSIEAPLAFKAWIARPAADRALALVGESYEKLVEEASRREFRPRALGLRADVEFEQSVRRFTSPNVVGILPGAERPDEAVVFLAHYDHLGIGRPVEGDSIYNGAIDNASGTAALLCLAQVFARSPEPPTRTLVFVATTAEEKGLLGAEYFAAHPAVPLERTILAINKDCCSFSGRREGFGAFPIQFTDAVPVFEKLGEEMGLPLQVGGVDRGGGAFRMDTFPFCARGVVGLSLGLGGKNLSLTEEEAAAIAKKVGPWYHQPNDEIHDHFRYDGILQELEILYHVGRHFADGGVRPRLLEGNPFGVRGGDAGGVLAPSPSTSPVR